MQKICFRILIILGLIIFAINIVAWGLYFPEEWNFNYSYSYDMYLKKSIIESSNDSQVHKICIRDKECKLMLDQFSFNGTISNVTLQYD